MQLVLPPNVIDVWLASIESPPAPLETLSALLDVEERERVARFRFEDDRARCAVTRAVLRILLGRYLERDPRELRFVLGPQGKPALAGGEIEFNVSHSGSFIALAFACTPVGVDVEHARDTRDLDGLAERFFAPVEAERVHNAPPAEVAANFYAIWTAKESVIKAVGGGLSIELASFVVTPSHEGTPVENRGDNPRLDGWFVHALPQPAPGYFAAVAAQGDGWMPVVRTLGPSDLS